MDNLDNLESLTEMPRHKRPQMSGKGALHLSQHLDSPVRGSVLQYMLGGGKVEGSRAVQIKASKILSRLSMICDHEKMEPVTIEIKDQSLCFTRIIQDSELHPSDERDNRHLWTSMKAAYRSVKLQEKAVWPDLGKIREEHLAELATDRDLQFYYHWRCYWRDVVYSMNSIALGQSKVETPVRSEATTKGYYRLIHRPSQIKGFVFGEGAMIVFKGQTFFLTREAVLMTSDIFQQRFALFCCSIIGERLGQPQSIIKHDLKRILRWGDELLVLRGQGAYSILKCFEGIVTSCLLEKYEERVCESWRFYEEMRREAEEQSRSKLDELRMIIMSLSNDHLVSQAFGLYRLWGHPTVKTAEGVSKIRQLGRARKDIDLGISYRCGLMFKKLFVEGFIRRHGRWPEVTCSALPSHSIHEYIAKGEAVPSSVFPLNHWSLIKLEKNFQADGSYNLSSLISDKALSLTKTKLIHAIKRFHNIGRAEDRRVILEWLKNRLTTAQDLLDEINREGFSPEDLVIGIVPKEREMKVEPRMFALLTLKARLYFVVTESMLAEHLLPYFPQITMTDSALDLTKKLLGITRSQKLKPSNIHNITINIDFEKWNTNMRKESTMFVFKQIDDLFGFDNVYQRSHDFFSESWIYLADEEALIEVDNQDLKEGEYCWRGHLGGLEGLRQKGWTLTTVCYIAMVTESLNVTHKLVGQGDNQVLLLTLRGPRFESEEGRKRSDQIVKDQLTLFKESFYRMMALVGLPVKAEETWESSNMFAYGKNLFLQGMPLCMSFKRFCRMYPMANESFPGIEQEISTIFGGGNAATQSDLDYIVPMFFASLQSCLAVLNNLDFSPLFGRALRNRSLSGEKRSWKISNSYRSEVMTQDFFLSVVDKEINELLLSILWTPRILGGYSVQMLPTFMSRGFPDPLCEAGSILRRMFVSSSSKREKAIIANILKVDLSPEIRHQLLIQDPVSVNIYCPVASGSRMKGFSERYLTRQRFPNEQFSDFLSFTKDPYDCLCDQVQKLRPYRALLLSDIVDASLPGFSKRVVSKVVKTTTILSQTAAEEGDAMLHSVSSAELENFTYRIWKFEKRKFLTTHDHVFQCTEKWAQDLRDRGWGKQVEGVTVAHPLEYLSVSPIEFGSCKECKKSVDHLKINIDPSLQCKPDSFLKELGPNIPYLGSQTKEKVTKIAGSGAVVNVEPVVSSAKRLLRTIGWFIPSTSEAAQLIRNEFESLTDLDSKEFETSADLSTGSEYHRYKSNRAERGGLCSTLYGITSYLQISTNSLESYAKSSKNTTIHFQCMMISLQQVVSSYLLRSHFKEYHDITGFHFHIRCLSCIRELEDAPLLGDENWSQVVFPSLKTGLYTYMKKEKASRSSIRDGLSSNQKYEELSADNQMELAYRSVGIKLAKSISRGTDPHIIKETLGLPIVWNVYLEPVALLQAVSLDLLIRFMGISLRGSEVMSKESCFNRARNRIIRLPYESFSLLSSIFIFTESRQEMSESVFKISSPCSAPFTVQASARAARDAIVTIINRWKVEMFYGVSPKLYVSIEEAFAIDCAPYIVLPLWFSGELQRSEARKILEASTKKTVEKEDYNLLCYDLISVVECTTERAVKGLPRWKTNEIVYQHRAEVEVSNASSRFICKEDRSSSQAPISQLWMEEPIVKIKTSPRDYEHLIYRQPSLETSAWAKVAGFIGGLGIPRESEVTIACVGDGTGGITAFCLRYFLNSRVLYNSLISFDQILPQSLPGFTPPSLDGNSDLMERLLNRDHISDLISDLTHPLFSKEILTFSPEGYRLIICDAEGYAWENFDKTTRIFLNLLNSTMKGGTLVIKCYASQGCLFKTLLKLFQGCFRFVYVERPHLSSRVYKECYIVGVSRSQVLGVGNALSYSESWSEDVSIQLFNEWADLTPLRFGDFLWMYRLGNSFFRSGRQQNMMTAQGKEELLDLLTTTNNPWKIASYIHNLVKSITINDLGYTIVNMNILKKKRARNPKVNTYLLGQIAEVACIALAMICPLGHEILYRWFDKMVFVYPKDDSRGCALVTKMPKGSHKMFYIRRAFNFNLSTRGIKNTLSLYGYSRLYLRYDPPLLYKWTGDISVLKVSDKRVAFLNHKNDLIWRFPM